MITEADTCRKYVLPKLYGAGWNDDQISEQKSFTDGALFPWASRDADVLANGLIIFCAMPETSCWQWSKPRRPTNFPATVFSKRRITRQFSVLNSPIQPTATASSSLTLRPAKSGQLDVFPKPAELWQRFRASEKIEDEEAASRLLTPANAAIGKGQRYYQEIAINRVVQAVLQGKKRILLTMATGTGKTAVAFQICWKLWNMRWNRAGEHRRPKILYLADRNILIDDPKDKMFTTFGDARWKIENGEVNKGREMYFAIYQAIAKDENRPGLYKEYSKDFFDLIIVDECHRGSAKDESNWREILRYFQPAFQLGMTATPLRKDNRDTYRYFGNPVYTYSLRQGIEDGFLAPYRVHRIVTEWDAAGWRPSQGDLDRYGRTIPDSEYQTVDFERAVALKARTEAIARNITDFLKKTDRFAKTIVFCVDQEHADEMRARAQ